jgi:hypothetical protein
MSTKTNANAWGRREFLAAAAGTAAVAYLPFGAVVAAPSIGATRNQEVLADWSIDDQWGVYPRYDALASAPRQHDEQRLAAVHPADLAFVA